MDRSSILIVANLPCPRDAIAHNRGTDITMLHSRWREGDARARSPRLKPRTILEQVAALLNLTIDEIAQQKALALRDGYAGLSRAGYR